MILFARKIMRIFPRELDTEKITQEYLQEITINTYEFPVSLFFTIQPYIWVLNILSIAYRIVLRTKLILRQIQFEKSKFLHSVFTSKFSLLSRTGTIDDNCWIANNDPRYPFLSSRAKHPFRSRFEEVIYLRGRHGASSAMQNRFLRADTCSLSSGYPGT